MAGQTRFDQFPVRLRPPERTRDHVPDALEHVPLDRMHLACVLGQLRLLGPLREGLRLPVREDERVVRDVERDFAPRDLRMRLGAAQLLYKCALAHQPRTRQQRWERKRTDQDGTSILLGQLTVL